MKKIGLQYPLMVALVLGSLAGCSRSTRAPDKSGALRDALDQAGFKKVSFTQDRDKGVVTLNGEVPAPGDKHQAETIARSIVNDEVVANQVAVVPPGAEDAAKKVNADLDDAIGKNLEAALIMNRLEKSVKYSVKNGVVTLTGEVRSDLDRGNAEKIASGVPNVQQVVNELQTKNRRATSSN